MSSKFNSGTSPAAHTLNEISLESSSEKWVGTYPPPKHPNTESRSAGKRTTGASLAANQSDVEKLKRWLDTHNLTARAFDFTDFEDFIRLIEEEQVTWAVVPSAGSILGHPEFDRLFRTLTETDTHLYTADDNCCLSIQLLLFAVHNWEFVASYACADADGPSLTSQADALRRIEARLREMIHRQQQAEAGSPSPASPKIEGRNHDFGTSSLREDFARLTQKERELLDAASPHEPLKGEELATKAGHQYDGHTKLLLSSLFKRGFLEKVPGGYVRSLKVRTKVRTDN